MKTFHRAWLISILLLATLIGCGSEVSTPDSTDAPAVTGPRLTIEPAAGPIGTAHIIIIEGFQPDDLVKIDFVLQASDEVVQSLAVRVGAAGSGRLEMVSTAEDTPGQYRVVGTDQSGQSAEAMLIIQ